MADRPWHPTDPDLEQALGDLGERLAYPSTPQLAAAVRVRLLAEQDTVRDGRRPLVSGPVRRMRSVRRRVALILASLLVLSGAVLALSPGARTAVASWLHLRGVTFFYAPHAPPLHAPVLVGTHLRLGRRVTLAQARAHAGFRILLPTTLHRPDEVYVGTPGQSGPAPAPTPGQAVQVALVYRAGAGLPRAATTGVGLLLTEFQGSPLAGKTLELGTYIETVTVDGAPGYWLTGKPHVFGYLDPKGAFYRESVRLAGNVLLWQRGGLLLRLESALPRDAALRIAASVR